MTWLTRNSDAVPAMPMVLNVNGVVAARLPVPTSLAVWTVIAVSPTNPVGCGMHQICVSLTTLNHLAGTPLNRTAVVVLNPAPCSSTGTLPLMNPELGLTRSGSLVEPAKGES